MIVLLNGSFGVGKTTVAKILHDSLTGSIIYNPEWAGSLLMRLPNWIELKRTGTGDFQHIKLWIKSVIAGTQLYRLFARSVVIVPMTFSSRDYFDEIVIGIKSFDSELRVFCLKASLDTVKRRLVQRGTQIEGAESEWIARRIVECADAHRDRYFGEPVDTECGSAHDVAQDIIFRLQKPNRSGGEC
ncbi:Tunicamycin resistance protein [Fischerella sp. NIES-4106]|nr:Tunicamycin resistance protein [Fischerella sp. NIES-4106]